MLFSNEKIAAFVNQSFEPVWVSVRSVPIVHVDFGQGHVLTRTLHGNIATYVCDPQGFALDIIPGIYDAETYLAKMRELRNLATWFADHKGQPAERINRYHHAHLEAHRQKRRLPAFVALDVTKSRVERPSKLILLPSGGAAPYAASAKNEASTPTSLVEELAADTKINESSRRAMIHQMFVDRGLVRPDDVTKWLYREVLHADIDDPYLGLRDVLFANYPFAEEEQDQSGEISELLSITELLSSSN